MTESYDVYTYIYIYTYTYMCIYVCLYINTLCSIVSTYVIEQLPSFVLEVGASRPIRSLQSS